MYTEEQNDGYQEEWNYIVKRSKEAKILGYYWNSEALDDLVIWLQHKIDTLQWNLAVATTFMDEIATQAENIDKKFLELQSTYEKESSCSTMLK